MLQLPEDPLLEFKQLDLLLQGITDEMLSSWCGEDDDGDRRGEADEGADDEGVEGGDGEEQCESMLTLGLKWQCQVAN